LGGPWSWGRGKSPWVKKKGGRGGKRERSRPSFGHGWGGGSTEWIVAVETQAGEEKGKKRIADK